MDLEGSTLSYDTETTGLRFYDNYPASMFSFSCGDASGDTQVFRLDGNALRRKRNTSTLIDLVHNPETVLVMHNSKFDITATNEYLQEHLEDTLQFHDTYLQSHLLQNDHPSHKLKILAWELAGLKPDDEWALAPYLQGGADYSQVPESIMDEYQHGDAFRTMLLHQFFYPKIASDPKLLDCYTSELNAVRTIIKMERRGVHISRRRCKKLMEHLSREVESTRGQMNDLLGTVINPNSAEQVRWALYKFAGLPVLARSARTREPSTKKEILFQLRNEYPHPVLDLVLRVRSYSRGIGMLASYLEYATSEDVIHSNLRSCAARTGRQSSSEPNIHNVSKTTSLLTPFPIPAREIFTPRPGFVNFHIDYAGEELRLLVHYSQEKELVDLINANGDPHALAAEVFYEDQFLHATGEMRKTLRGSAKNTNFAIPYGASLRQVAVTLGLPLHVAKRRLANYVTRFPRLCSLTNTVSDIVRADGGVRTVFGRFLKVPYETAYVGTNYLIQGTAAEILKRAQWRIYKILHKHTGDAAQLILTVHDEVVIEWPRDMLGEALPILREIREAMIDFPQFSVPLEIEVSIVTQHWANKKEVSLHAT